MRKLIISAFLIALLPGCSDKTSNTTAINSGFVKDNASGDTPVETLKTLTADISTVEQQNQKIVAANNTLTLQNKTTFDQFKKDVLSQVQQQITNAKIQQQNQTTNNPSPVTASGGNNTNNSNNITGTKLANANNNTNTNDGANGSATGFVWVEDLQQITSNDNGSKNTSSSEKLAALLNPGSTDKSTTDTNSTTNSNTALLPSLTDLTHKKSLAVPYYTIPVNATLTGAVAMQPLIGRVPIDGKVPDPYTFKAIIGSKNLAANGIDIPSDIQGIVIAGVAEGDMLGRCARGEVTAMTFVFQDGRISTTRAKDGESLGTISAANGNPCIAGTFHTDAGLYLGVTAGLAGVQGYGNALSQAQLSTATSPTTGASISTLIGSANKYAFGQGFSASSQAAQKWWDQRVQNSFDFVYVPNVDPKTGKKLQLNINITQEIPIDYNPTGRKVFYDHTQNNTNTLHLD